MIPGLLDFTPVGLLPADSEPQVLLVVNDTLARSAMAGALIDAGFSITASGPFGIVELLEDGHFDLLVAAQPFEEMAHFGVPQLARSVQPELPILVLEADAAEGEGMLEAVQDTIERWPLRVRAARQYH